MADIEVTRDGAIATVLINQPALRNAMTLAMWRETARVFCDLGRECKVRGLALTGAERPAEMARQQLRGLAAGAPLSIAGAKAILTGLSTGRGALDLDEAERLVAGAADSHDYRQGRRAFAEARAPRFDGS
jgi:enoyl-CoA hydratase/carnithine racemase